MLSVGNLNFPLVFNVCVRKSWFSLGLSLLLFGNLCFPYVFCDVSDLKSWFAFSLSMFSVGNLGFPKVFKGFGFEMLIFLRLFIVFVWKYWCSLSCSMLLVRNPGSPLGF